MAVDANAAARPWQAHYPDGTPLTVAPTHRLLGDLASERGRATPDSRALTCIMANGMSGCLTYGQVDRHSDQFAAYLREELRLKTGDRVGIQIPNGLAYGVCAFGIFKAGCVLVNINPLYTGEEAGKVFADAGLSALVVIDMFSERTAQALAIKAVPHVILTAAAEFFPAMRRKLIGFVQKYVRKEIPAATFPHRRLSAVLAAGARHLAAGNKIASYTRDIEPTAVACLQYTGGTTGVSKGAMLTHRNLIMNAAQVQALAGTHISATDHVLTALPLYHIFAFTVNFLCFYVQSGHIVLIPNPRPLTNLQKAFEKERITFITGVNTLFNGLLNERWFQALSKKDLRVAVAGGMALQQAVSERWMGLTGQTITEGYGLTETSPVVTFNPFGTRREGAIGLPLPMTDVKCVDDQFNEVASGEPGELAVRGPQVMAGYWQRPDETAKVMRGDWLLTGDIARMDPDGYFRIVDRRKDMILVSGFNVFPNEVEDVLAKMPGVREGAVIGIPDGASGEAVKAFVVRSDPTLTQETVRSYCKQHLTGYKVPKVVEFRDELPKSNVGKILRKDLRG